MTHIPSIPGCNFLGGNLGFVDRSIEDFVAAGIDVSPSARVFSLRAASGLTDLEVSLLQ